LPAIGSSTKILCWNIDDPYGQDLATYRACAEALALQLATLPL
jgi:hypothetical protein